MVTILGRFPPPIDGQTMATDRLARLLADAVEVQRVNLSSGERALAESAVRFRLDRISHYLSVRRRLRTALGTHPDAAVFWTSISPAPLGHLRDLVTILPALRGRRSVYAVVHWGNFDTVFRSAATRPTARHLVRALRGVVFLNETLAERCAAWIPPEKRFVVPNTIDDEVRCHAGDLRRKADMRQTDRPLRLLFLSNMTPTKGYGDVLEAVRLLHERGVPIQADFAGRWETDQDAAAFAEAVHRYRLGDFITHHGGISDRTRVKALYLNADVFLLPTYYPTEAQPLSIIEALNAATPVITTRHAGIPDMVRDEKEALFVPPKSPESIADAVERLRDSAFWNQASRAARTRFETTFHPDVVRRHWLALLDAP